MMHMLQAQEDRLEKHDDHAKALHDKHSEHSKNLEDVHNKAQG